MKILLRNHSGEQYVWKTAKYHNGAFHVNGTKIKQNNIVSIVNDNRKNYIECSCCGQTFKKGSRHFQTHRENADSFETCLGCPNMIVDYDGEVKRSFHFDKDGRLVQKSEDYVTLRCTQCGLWQYELVTSDTAISRCKKRQCKDATEVEINDFFTRNPGAFDDILTIDTLLDAGYDVGVAMEGRDGSIYDLIYENDYSIDAYVNRLGIVDLFGVWYDGDKYYLQYSKKYDQIFHWNRKGEYEVWNVWNMSTEMREEIKEQIAKFYR